MSIKSRNIINLLCLNRNFVLLNGVSDHVQ